MKYSLNSELHHSNMKRLNYFFHFQFISWNLSRFFFLLKFANFSLLVVAFSVRENTESFQRVLIWSARIYIWEFFCVEIFEMHETDDSCVMNRHRLCFRHFWIQKKANKTIRSTQENADCKVWPSSWRENIWILTQHTSTLPNIKHLACF